MPNRSISSLPSFYAPAPAHSLDNTEASCYPLGLFRIDYLHFHSLMELGVCRRGRGVCVVEGAEYPFTEGDVQVIFPFQNHLSRSIGSTSEWLWVNIDPIRLLSRWGMTDLPHWEHLLRDRMGLCGILDRTKYAFCAELVRRTVLPGPQPRRVACLAALIEELAFASSGLPSLSLRPGRAFVQLEPALTLAQEKLRDGVSPQVSDLAKACSLSAPAFRRSFRQAMGQSPQEYIRNCQMNEAQRLLLFTDMPVTQIAFTVGYQDVSGFNRRFLHSFGTAPRNYRNEMRKETSSL